MTTFHTQLPQHAEQVDKKKSEDTARVADESGSASASPDSGVEPSKDGLSHAEQAKVEGEHERRGSHGGDGNYDDRDIFADTDVRESGRFELRPEGSKDTSGKAKS